MAEGDARKNSSGEAVKVVKEVTFRIERYIADEGRVFWKDYRVPVVKGMTVLDGLNYIKAELDSSLSWRASCRMAVCGSCAMFIDRFPRLACHTQILDLNKDVLEIAPLPNFDNLRDLIPDLVVMFEKHKNLKPFISRKKDAKEVEHPTGEFIQSEEELLTFLQFTYCIKCGICLAACPTVATDSRYIGPQALAQAFRYSVDTRDEGLSNRIDDVDTADGPWKCHFAGACSEACPKGVDPALGIQLLKRAIIMGMDRGEPAPSASGPPKDAKRRDGVPDAPERTV